MKRLKRIYDGCFKREISMNSIKKFLILTEDSFDRHYSAHRFISFMELMFIMRAIWSKRVHKGP